MIINEIISSILQVIVFTMIPFIVYVIKYRRARGFFEYIGLQRTTWKAIALAGSTALLFLAGALLVVALDAEMRAVMMKPPTVTGKLREMGLQPASLFVLLLIAWVKTSLAEEILFRGFIATRLMHSFGFVTGNLLQSILFAAVHVLLFLALATTSAFFLLFIFLISGLAAYVIGHVKVKWGNNSIVPGWIAHGLGNTISYFVIAYLL